MSKNSTPILKIISDCPDCGSTYEEGLGGMYCRSCGKIESYRMVALRCLMGVEEGFRSNQVKKGGGDGEA